MKATGVNRMKNSNVVTKKEGFTLVELMVTVFISTILIIVISATYRNQQKLYKRQEAVVDMQQNIRASLYLLSQELRMAGYNPLNIPGVGIQQLGLTSTSITFTQDITDATGTATNGNGAIDGPNETVTIIFDNDNADGDECTAANPCIQRDTGGGEQPFLNNIDFLEIAYLNDNNIPFVPTAATIEDIAYVQLTILVRSSINEPDFINNLQYFTPAPMNTDITAGGTFDDGRRRRIATTTVQLRNASL